MTNTNPQTGNDDIEEVIKQTIRDATNQMRRTASDDYKASLNKKFAKLQLPDWLNKTTFLASNITIAAFALVAGCVLSKDGMSDADHEKAMKAQEQQYTKTIEDLKKTHNDEKTGLVTAKDNLQRQLNGAIQRAAPGSSDAFDIWTTAAVRTSESGGHVFTAPSVFLATLDMQGRRQLFNDIADHGDVKFGMSNTLAFYANKAAAADPSMHPYKVAVIPQTLMTSPEKIAALEEAFNSMQTDIATKYPASQTPIGYRFELVAGGPTGKGLITVARDIHVDKRTTAADDMVIVGTHEIR